MRFRTLLVLAILLTGLPVLAQQTIQVAPTLETQPVIGTGAVVQGAALWMHPTDPASSLLLVADNQTGLLVYNLNGTQRPLLAEGAVQGVDVQEGVVVGGISQTLVMVANTSQQALIGYIIDPSTLQFRRAGFANVTAPSFAPNSVALYVSPSTGRVFAFAGSATGLVVQFELTALTDGGTASTDGGIVSSVVRSFDVGNAVVGLAVDDSQGKLYVVEQGVGIWEYGAEPEAADARVSVDTATGGGGGLAPPLGGVALYRASGLRGYLLAVSGGDNAVRIYERQSGAHTFRGSFTVVADGGIDAVETPREVVVTNRPLGTLFPLGMVAVHDSANPGANENFKLVPWPAIATGFTTPLVVDTGTGEATDGGTADGGTADGGSSAPPTNNVPPSGPLGESPEGGVKAGQACACASASVPGTMLLTLLGVLLLSRRRPGA